MNILSKKLLLVCSITLLTTATFAQSTAAAPVTSFGVWSNPVFLLLVALALILIVVIRSLSKALLNIAINDAKKNKTNTILIAIALLSSFLLPGHAQAQAAAVADAAAPVTSSGYFGLSALNFWGMICLILIELLVVFQLLSRINKFLTPPADAKAAEPNAIGKFFDTINGLKPIEQEPQMIMQNHSYDGIQELDNGMPPWLKYMFIGTVAFAFIYLVNYHIFRTGMLQTAEYENDVKQANIELAEFRKKAGNSVDETTVKLMKDAADLNAGKEIYKANCVACHGANGEGLVGPNLTDDHWKHGGSIQSIFKTIKYGVVEKGMKSWQTDLSPMQMQEVASYIKSLHGTNPANPKAPEGDLYLEATASADSTTAKVDSTGKAIMDTTTTAVVNK
jgi:cytochrome c oxidase cbb3-type subunit 3